MKRFFFLILMLPVFLSAQNEPINEDWLKKDKTNFLNLMDVILSNNKTVDFYQKEIQNLSKRSDLEIGFNTKKHTWAQYGGYFTNWIFIYSYNGIIFYCKIYIEPEAVEKMELLAQRDPIISKLLDQNWNRKSFEHNSKTLKTLDYEYLDKELYAKYKGTVENEIGIMRDKKVDTLIQKDFQVLTSLFEYYDYGEACYYSGSAPEGRTAIEKIKKNNPDLLRDIIRGHNPEGRIYGVEAILELASQNKLELTAEDRQTIKKVIGLSTLINRCVGCMVDQALAKEIFKEEYLSKLLNKNNIHIK